VQAAAVMASARPAMPEAQMKAITPLATPRSWPGRGYSWAGEV
jgi:hypothetical protein